jgi:hypothetical protein
MSLRRESYRAALAVPGLRALAIGKDARIAAHAIVCVVVAFVVALFAPVVSLVIAPLLFGLPHLASEARVVLQRARPPRAALVTAAVVSLLLVGVGAASFALPDSRSLAHVECTIAFGGLGLVLAVMRSPVARALAIVAAALAFGCALSFHVAMAMRVLVVVAHAFVALAVWALVFRARRLYAAPAIVLALAGFLALVALRSPVVALAFASSVHYALWLAIIPQEASAANGAPTWRMTARVWLRDIGGVGLAFILAACVLLVVSAAAMGAPRARDAYLAAARFHVWLELPVAAFLGFGGLAPGRAT